MKRITLVIFCLFLGCASIKGDDGWYMVIGRSKIEECREVVILESGEVIKQECTALKSEGISGEFAALLKAIFGFIWPF